MFKKLICFFGERFESDIIRTAKNKQKSQELFSAMTNKQQPFPGGPLLGIQQNKGNRGGGGLENVKMVPSNNHSQHTWKPGQQQHQINISHSFKDTEVKLYHSKIAPPNKMSLSYNLSASV